MDPGRGQACRARYDGSAHRARQFNRPWFGDYDLVIAWTGGISPDLRRMADQATAETGSGRSGRSTRR
jgi:hypothetical protein